MTTNLVPVQTAFALITQIVHCQPSEYLELDLDLTMWNEANDDERTSTVGVVLGCLHGALTMLERAHPSFDMKDWTSALAARTTLGALAADAAEAEGGDNHE